MADARQLPRDDEPCPCGTALFGACCRPVLDGRRAAPTAEALMRSRYTAFAVGDADHLVRTWHPSTRPTTLVLEPDLEWRRLVVLDVTAGSPWDDAGEVEFVAHYRAAGARGRLHERSRFVREGGWLYVDGVEPTA